MMVMLVLEGEPLNRCWLCVLAAKAVGQWGAAFGANQREATLHDDTVMIAIVGVVLGVIGMADRSHAANLNAIL